MHRNPTTYCVYYAQCVEANDFICGRKYEYGKKPRRPISQPESVQIILFS